MAKSKGKILVVDDNSGIRAALKLLLPMHFTQVEVIPSPVELISRIADFQPDVVLLDMNFHTDINTGNEGLYWLSEIKKRRQDIEVVLFTAYADIKLAVEGMKRGAFDFIVKPWENDKLVETLENAYRHRLDATGGARQEKPAKKQMMWGHGQAMTAIRKTVEKIAPTDATVLITGENGTGKDVLAGEIHRLSERNLNPMVSVDVGAITETLFESELFGHVKGAFTDAHADHIGKFEQANGGTLFLDEIGNLPYHLQAKLLTVLQSRSVVRVGSNEPIPVDVRLICATNANLDERVAQGKFREDLLYRINTIHLEIPPLRERKEDIVPLAELFIEHFAKQYDKGPLTLSEEAKQKLKEHPWYGNIRELEHAIEKAVIISDGVAICDAVFHFPKKSLSPAQESAMETLEDMELVMIRKAIDKHEGNLSAVASQLGITRQTLYNKMKKYGL